MKGKVKKFNDKLGYGFIKSYDYDKDIFVHFSHIQMNGYKTLYKGDLVEFDFNSDKVRAEKVKILKSYKNKLKDEQPRWNS